MVERTRLKVMDDKLVRHDEILNEVLTTQEKLRNTQTGIQGTLELILERLTNLERVPQRAQGDRPQGDRLLPISGQELRKHMPQAVHAPSSKWELPYFEGHEPKELMGDIVEEFNKLSQVGSVDGFLGKFEDLKVQMFIRNPHLDESHFISSFIGLKEEIRFGVKLFKPTTLRFAVEQARLQEKAIEAAHKRTKVISKPSFVAGNSASTRVPAAAAVKPNSFRLNPEVYEYRKSNHLCYKCGEKYTPGHQCKKKQLNCMIGAIENLPENNEIEEKQPCADLIIEGELEQEVMEPVCMNALLGDNRGVNTNWFEKMQGRPFQENILIIPLGGCDMVMVNDWMKKHNPTKFDHEKMCVTIGKKGNKLVYQGIFEEGKLNMISSGTMGKILKKGQALIAHLFMMNSFGTEDQEPVGEAIKEVLHQYPDVFEEPKSLLHVRTLDHTIPLKPGAMPVNLRPYRKHSLFAKKSKCSFGQSKVEYLGHIITAEGVSNDPSKIQAMVYWPRPNSLRALRGFLGLIGYYRKTVHHSLKYLLEQRVTYPIQQKGLTKLLGLDYEVQYKKGAENRVADALSRQQEESEGGHSGQLGTLKRLSQVFYWPRMKQMVIDYVASCDICLKSKDDNMAYPGLLQPLPIPNHAWSHINMDFTEEWWYNTNFHTSLQCTSFEALYGYTPPQLSLGPILETVVQAAEETMMRRQQMQQLLKDNLTKAQERMKYYADKRRSDREFQVGYMVYLKLQPYRQTSFALRKNLKLSSKYYGPYKVSARVGMVAYKLDLPPESKVYHVFRVSLIMRKVGNRVVVQTTLPITGVEGQFLVKLVAILQRQLIKRNNAAMVRVLVQ
ncbi:putative mitochondrial protein [Nicotiana attenuata]|uniref:Mitochondrial protein n=1 Tax=Nicotiana attenuata TaxID=49451 RepID=A0A1J6IKB6_NICAT|nr:putative mitochondrial protein [Nicotiana attenuata]